MTWWNIDTDIWPGPSGLVEYNSNGFIVLHSLRASVSSDGKTVTVQLPEEEYDEVKVGQICCWSSHYPVGIISSKKIFKDKRDELNHIVNLRTAS